jgi:hypothetical protein
VTTVSVAVDATSPTSNESSTSTTSTAAAPESTPVAMLFDLGGGTPVAPSWMTEVAQIHRLSTGVAAAEDSAAALDPPFR